MTSLAIPASEPVFRKSLSTVLAPPQPVTPSKWAADNLIVPDGQRAGGRWDPTLTPYVPDIIDALGPDSDNNFVVVRKGVQTGISMAGIALCGSYIDRAPCRIGYALPTITLMQEFQAEKLSPTIDMTPALRRKVKAQTSRSSTGSTATRKKYPGGALSLINANSATDLKSRTLKVGVADEIDAWADAVGDDGDPFGLFQDRFTFFHSSGDWKMLALSTPTFSGTSRVDRMFKDGDQRFWHIECPGCGEWISFEFKHLEFERKPPYKAYYEAQCCGRPIEAHEKPLLVRKGKFIPQNEDGLYPSFHVDALVSLVTTWDMVAQAWWESHGDWQKEQRFYNSQLGLPYEMKGDAPDWQRLMERRVDYPENRVPERGIILVAGVDVQHNGLWVEVVAFGYDRQSWSISARFLEGDTDDFERGAWLKLSAVYDERFPDAFGGSRRIEAMAVDAGDGGRANQVYCWTRSRDRAHAIFGRSGWPTPAIGAPTKVDITLHGKRRKRGALLWPVGTWSLKGDHYAALRKQGKAGGAEEDPAGYCHFGMFLDENYFKQITAEYLAEENFKGRPRKVWKQGHENNHLLDCRVYAMAMADKLGMNRMSPEQWLKVASQIGIPVQFAQPVEEEEAIIVPAPPRPAKRKVRRSSWMN